MEESRRESRFPTKSNPSSGSSRERNVKPRSCVRNVSQYLTCSGPVRILFLFCTVMNFGINASIQKRGNFKSPRSCFGFEDLLHTVHQVLRAKRFGDVIIHFGNVQ